MIKIVPMPSRMVSKSKTHPHEFYFIHEMPVQAPVDDLNLFDTQLYTRVKEIALALHETLQIENNPSLISSPNINFINLNSLTSSIGFSSLDFANKFNELFHSE